MVRINAWNYLQFCRKFMTFMLKEWLLGLMLDEWMNTWINVGKYLQSHREIVTFMCKEWMRGLMQGNIFNWAGRFLPFYYEGVTAWIHAGKYLQLSRKILAFLLWRWLPGFMQGNIFNWAGRFWPFYYEGVTAWIDAGKYLQLSRKILAFLLWRSDCLDSCREISSIEQENFGLFVMKEWLPGFMQGNIFNWAGSFWPFFWMSELLD